MLGSFSGRRSPFQILIGTILSARSRDETTEAVCRDLFRRYPTAEEGLVAIQPYLKKTLPNDPWGRPYVYRVPGHAGEYDVFSYGRDGKAGGTGEDADIGFAGPAQDVSLNKQ